MIVTAPHAAMPPAKNPRIAEGFFIVETLTEDKGATLEITLAVLAIADPELV